MHWKIFGSYFAYQKVGDNVSHCSVNLHNGCREVIVSVVRRGDVTRSSVKPKKKMVWVWGSDGLGVVILNITGK